MEVGSITSWCHAFLIKHGNRNSSVCILGEDLSLILKMSVPPAQQGLHGPASLGVDEGLLRPRNKRPYLFRGWPQSLNSLGNMGFHLDNILKSKWTNWCLSKDTCVFTRHRWSWSRYGPLSWVKECGKPKAMNLPFGDIVFVSSQPSIRITVGMVYNWVDHTIPKFHQM